MDVLAFACVMAYGALEAVHWFVMAELTKRKEDHANFVFVNGICGFLPLAVIGLGYAIFVELPSFGDVFWICALVGGIFQCFGLNGITWAARGGKLTWLLSLDSISPVILAGVAYFSHGQELTPAQIGGVVVIVLGLVVKLKWPSKKASDPVLPDDASPSEDAPLPDAVPPADNPPPLEEDSLPDARGWRSRILRFFAKSSALYLISRLVWLPYPPVVQEASYSVHPTRKQWVTPAFVMAPVFLVGAIISFFWKSCGAQRKIASEQTEQTEQTEQLKWRTVVRLAGASAWEYFVRSRWLFAVDGAILFLQQFAEITAFIHANLGAVSALMKSTVVFTVIIKAALHLIRRLRGKGKKAKTGSLNRRERFRKWRREELGEAAAIFLLTAGAFVMVL